MKGIKRHLCVVAAVAALGMSGLVAHTYAADMGADIEEIMKKAFKGAGGPKKPGAPGGGGAAGGAPAGGAKKPSLVQKAVDGTASADEIKSLLGYCQDLAKAKPPKGDQKDWDERCTKMVNAVEAISKGDKSAGPKLKEASNCKACHELHKES